MVSSNEFASQHGKLSVGSADAEKWSRLEDLLTADVFGAFRYLPPSRGLWPFLETAKDRQGSSLARWLSDRGVDLRALSHAEFVFWPALAGRSLTLEIAMSNNDNLTTIRRAYRYVAAYERRVLDAVQLVSEALGAQRFQFRKWEPLMRSMPKTGTFGPSVWAWDNLPHYAVRYRWSLLEDNANVAGNAWCFLDHVADTGFERCDRKREPDPLGLGHPSEADTHLRLHWFYMEQPLPQALWALTWDALLSRHFARPASEIYRTAPTEAPHLTSHAGVHTGSHCVSLSKIVSANALQEALILPSLKELKERLPREG